MAVSLSMTTYVSLNDILCVANDNLCVAWRFVTISKYVSKISHYLSFSGYASSMNETQLQALASEHTEESKYRLDQYNYSIYVMDEIINQY